MSNYSSFNPDWTSSPGDTISDILKERKITKKDLAQRMGLTTDNLKALLAGKLNLTLEIAQILEQTLGASKSFWLNREVQYREELERTQNGKRETADWLKLIPFSDMVKYGWVERATKASEKTKTCLDFFNVDSVNTWYKTYENLHTKAAFRTSGSFDSNPVSVVTWLRAGEILSTSINCRPFDKSLFEGAILKARYLTRTSNPSEFIPKLTNLFSASGVTLVIAPTPKGCSASGATFFPVPDKAVMMLSFRHLSDDHFWFTLFHEAAHIILHDKNSLFLEGINNNNDQEEAEANLYSERVLIPVEHLDEFMSLRASKWRNIVRFSKKIDVSPGIVVGQLQFHGIIGHHQLNKFKTRYRWE